MTADEALQTLKEGNRRFAGGHPANPRRDPGRRSELVSGQHPFAAVLTCSDSRVVPEIVFDQGLGDLFSIRVPGNVVDETVLGSLELGVEHLGIPLVVVLGHTQCGALIVALAAEAAGDHRQTLIKLLQPALDASAGGDGDPEKRLERAVRANVRLAVEGLRQSTPTLAPLHGRGALRIVGAVYGIETGLVDWVEG
jgi:carbonic anhydrase